MKKSSGNRAENMPQIVKSTVKRVKMAYSESADTQSFKYFRTLSILFLANY